MQESCRLGIRLRDGRKDENVFPAFIALNDVLRASIVSYNVKMALESWRKDFTLEKHAWGCLGSKNGKQGETTLKLAFHGLTAPVRSLNPLKRQPMIDSIL